MSEQGSNKKTVYSKLDGVGSTASGWLIGLIIKPTKFVNKQLTVYLLQEDNTVLGLNFTQGYTSKFMQGNDLSTIVAENENQGYPYVQMRVEKELISKKFNKPYKLISTTLANPPGKMPKHDNPFFFTHKTDLEQPTAKTTQHVNAMNLANSNKASALVGGSDEEEDAELIAATSTKGKNVKDNFANVFGD